MKGKISKSPSYLVRNPYTYCFRMNVPQDLQRWVCKKELRYSLRTGYLGLAKQRARLVAGQVQYLFRFLRKGGALLSKLTDAKIQEIVQEYLEWKKQDLEEWVLDEEGPFDDIREYNEYLDMLDGLKERGVHGLATGNYELVESTINNSLLEHGIRDVKKGSKEYIKLCRRLLQANIDTWDYEKKYFLNELPDEPNFPMESQGTPSPSPPEETPSPTLKEVIGE